MTSAQADTIITLLGQLIAYAAVLFQVGLGLLVVAIVSTWGNAR